MQGIIILMGGLVIIIIEGRHLGHSKLIFLLTDQISLCRNRGFLSFLF